MSNLFDFKKKLADQLGVKWSSNTSIEFLWKYDVSATPAQLWPYLADTSRFNRELGLAPRTESEIDGKLEVTTSIMGLKQVWIEEPWMWISEKLISAERNYNEGIGRYVQAVYFIEEIDRKSRVWVYFGWVPKNAFWNFFIKVTESVLKNKFAECFKKIETFLQKNENKNEVGTQAFVATQHQLSSEQINRLKQIEKKLLEKNLDKKFIDPVLDYVKNGDDLDLDALRVVKFSAERGFYYKDILKVCLHSTRLGLFNISWEMVCPHCKGSRFSAKSLGEIPKGAKCEPCEVEFTTEQQNTVEVVFKIHPSIRKISTAVYCAAEPAKKNHIKIQQKISANENFEVGVPRQAGLYRARLKGQADEVIFRVTEKVEDRTLDLELLENLKNISEVGLGSKIKLFNESDLDLVVVVEELRSLDLVLRPEHLFFFSDFKDLFSEEHLKSDVKIHLGEQSLLFTDIVGSTVFYDKVGDAKAFADVQKHFVDVFAEVKGAQGEVVKTIGDAVMAAFPTPEAAYSAAVHIQKKFSLLRDDLQIRLRISIHTGPVIAVHLDSGLDYFGSTINKCAKIQNLAGGGEIVMTEDLFQSLNLSDKNIKNYQQLYGAQTEKPIPVRVLSIS